MKPKDTDLRVLKTRQAIHKALCDMIVEMEYQDITVKELVQRAMINRNTFYKHYASVDALLEELQNEIAEEYISMFISYENIEDVREMIRRFFEYVTSQSPLQERILCSDSYRFLAERINARIMEHRKQTRHGAFTLSEAGENIVLAYYGSIAAVLFRQWVADGKQLSVEELIALATKLICSGMESIISH